MRRSPNGWAVLAAYVVLWDLACPEGETLSHGSARAMARNPVLTAAGIIYTSLHLMDVLPKRVDLFHQSGRLTAARLRHR